MRTFINYTQSPQLLSPDTGRQRQYADMLRQQSMQEPQGEMVSGHYVAPSITQGLSRLYSGYQAGQLGRQADETDARRQKAISDALRTPEEIPAGIRAPNYQPPQLTDRLAGLQDNPQAQQMAMQLRMQQAMQQPEGKYQTLAPEQVKQMGLGDGVWQMSPQGQISQAYAPQAPDYNKPVIIGPDGQPMPNPAYVQAQSQIRAAGASKQNTNIDMGNLLGGGQPQTEIGTVPPGYEAYYNPQTQGYQYRQIPGGPAAIEQAQLDEKMQGAEDKTRSTANLVVEDIQRAKDIIQQNPDFTTGLLGPAISKWGGTPAANLNSLLDTVGANISFDYLNTMRQNSPTGGALGNVTERELDLLRATAGNLKQSQGADQLIYNLERLERQFNEVINGPQAVQEQPNQAAPSGIDPELLQYMSPEERALFE